MGNFLWYVVMGGLIIILGIALMRFGGVFG